MINALIIDDQEINCILLQGLLENFFPNNIKPHATSNAPEALELISQIKPDLLFLDITMPEMNGFELLHQIRKKHQTEVIFVTAYGEFALNAFEHQALGYITKPVVAEKFVQTVTRAIEWINQKKEVALLETLKQTPNPNDKKITLTSQKGLTFVEPANILYCESSGNYTTFFLTNREQIVVSKQIGSFEKKLITHSIIRVHDRYLVNLQHVTTYLRGNGGSLVLNSGKEIPVSVRRKTELLTFFETK
ncbi:LytTR family DNA-binding domain-containing protein [Fluviicola sp.]|uniref:LytR/AlgR family response regulator transcription factor n=1 Tax=Fluviicola sp. TaxID=1917219 RepID=UPI0026057C04|nr:LytTR family DNA-binding domain-containing protein [Fluviicola sp.]